VHELEPGNDQGWLEWSKLQDECGDLEGALETVLRGISEGRKTAAEEERWHPSEALVLRALRLCERLNKIPEARELIVKTCINQNFEKVARIVFEGAQLEARIGQVARARKLYAFLMNAMPWYGPLYYEAFRLEETGGHYNTCLRIITRGLQELRRYGPLWFGLLRVVERADFESERVGWATEGTTPQLKMVRYYVEHAVNNINQELVWKVYYELAQIESRAVEFALKGRLWQSQGESEPNAAAIRNKLLAPTREAYAKSLATCPVNLRWKVLLAGARMELEAENVELCRKLLRDAIASTHSKTRGLVYLDCSRVEECFGNLDVSREILRRAQLEVPGECKICLEQAMLEARANNYVEAMNAAVKAVEFHSGAGRLWALLIQLVPKAWRSDKKRAKKIAFQIMEKSNSSCVEDSGCGVNKTMSSSFSSLAVTDTERSLEVIDSASTFEKLKVLRPSKEPEVRDVSSMQALRKMLLKCALREVPKSGEVWCEAARCCLNPMEKLSDFDLSLAHRYLSYSLVFTSQYGDCFIEKIRLELLSQVLLGDILSICGINMQGFFERFFVIDVADSNADLLASAKKRRFDSKLDLLAAMNRGVSAVLGSSDDSTVRSRSPNSDTSHSSDGIDGGMSLERRLLRRKALEQLCSMNYDFGMMIDHYKSVVLTKLYRLCDQVDPNYGSTWFFCKMFATESLSDIFAHSVDHIIHELFSVQSIYARAIVHYVHRSLKLLLQSQKVSLENQEYLFGDSYVEERRGISEFLEDFECAMKSLRKHGAVGVMSTCIASGGALCVVDTGDGVYFSDDFTSALISHSRAAFGSNLSRDDMRKFLFSTEQVIP
jgi:la-related protein 1